ncbi:hypothetical protein [Clostridium sp.]|uniref:hypothetical protein n=1 Tax=Clostridium sp. TaxID=1506 RepID=UPI001DBF7303|nr:hypothetical protein [Clostridium sp.]MBS5937737.1 hypothetical protein [Clostridium sp.]
MKELSEFIKRLTELEYEAVSLEVIFGDADSARLIDLEDILSSIEKIGIKEVSDIYTESFEFYSNNGTYMSINAVY